MNRISVKNIFAAVFNKETLEPLLEILDRGSVKFWGTEGTVKYLRSKGFMARPVVSGFDFDARIKTLDRNIFIRVLADRSKKRHTEELKRLKLEPFDLVIVDLYEPSAKNFPESMDIGGQALIRAAVKNYQNVAVAFDQKSIEDLVSEINKNGGSTTLNSRKVQAQKAAKFIAGRCKIEVEMIEGL